MTEACLEIYWFGYVDMRDRLMKIKKSFGTNWHQNVIRHIVINSDAFCHSFKESL